MINSEKITEFKNAIISKISSLISTHNASSTAHPDIRSHIAYGHVDSTSTATAYTATVDGITSLKDGTTVLLKNGVVTSAAGFTININGLGAKPVYSNLAAATADTTIFNVNYTMLFVYDETRISGGCWICYKGYDSNTNTIGYQLRTNSAKFISTDKGYKYRLYLQTSDDEFMPVNLSTSTEATSNKSSAMNTREFWIGGQILYNSTNGTIAANSQMSATTLWTQYTLSLGYSFNNTSAALSLSYPKPVYMVAKPTSNGKARLNTPYYTQTIPSTENGLIYILLGYMYSATSLELILEHPVYEYKNGNVRLYREYYTSSEVDDLLDDKVNVADAFNGSYNDLSNKPTIPSKTSQLTNDSGYLTTHQDISGKENSSNKTSTWNATTNNTRYPTEKLVKDSLDNKVDKEAGKSLFSGSYNDLSNKPTIPSKTSQLTNDSGYLTSHQDISGKVDKETGKGLSTNDYTDAEKTKLANIDTNMAINITKQATADTGYFATYVLSQGGSNLSTKINIPKDFLIKSGSVKTVATANNPVSGYKVGDKYLDLVINAKDNSATDEHIYVLVSDLVDTEVTWGNVTGKPTFSTVATSGSYNDLSNKPTIPSKTSQLTNDSGYLTSHQDISGKEDKTNKTTIWNPETNNTRYPTEKLVKDSLDNKANSTHNHTKSDITDFPTIPSASGTTPLADTLNGNVGNGTTWARNNHTHPKSDLYAEASHNHTASEITDFQSAIPIRREDCIIIEINITDVNSLVYFNGIGLIFDGNNYNYPIIDWGDGDITDDTNEHLYDERGKYEIKIQPSYGEIKVLPSEIFRNEGQFADNRITLIQIPSTVSYIGDYFCEGNSELKSIRLPSKVEMESNAISGNIEIEEIILSGKPYMPNLPRDNYNGQRIKYLVEEKYYDEWEPFFDLSGISRIFKYNDDVVLLEDNAIGNDNKHAISGSAISSALDYKISKSYTSGLVKNDGTIDTTQYSTFDGNYNSLSNKPTIPSANSTASNIKMDGTQSAGNLSIFAKADHVHPTDTSRAAATHNHTKSEITDFPTSMTPSSHTHGDITNDGAMTTSGVDKDTGDWPVVTDNSDGKKLKRGQIYTGFVWDNYARPNIGTAAQATQTAINAAIDTALGNKVDTSDSRLSDARNPKMTKIPSNSDLNNYTTAGFYYNDYNVDAETIANRPNYGVKAFYLQVEKWGNDNNIKQTISSYHHQPPAPLIYVRTKNGANTWSDWRQVSTYNEPKFIDIETTLTSTGSGTDTLRLADGYFFQNKNNNWVIMGEIKVTGPAARFEVQVPTNTDANNLIAIGKNTGGNYSTWWSTSASAEDGHNDANVTFNNNTWYPFSMVKRDNTVTFNFNNTKSHAHLPSYMNGHTYLTPQLRTWTTSNVSIRNLKIIPHITDSLQDVTTNIDFNDYKKEGKYLIWGAKQTGNTNAPDTQGGLLEVKAIPNGVKQTLSQYYAENPKIFYRIFHSTTGWRAWKEVVTSDDTRLTNSRTPTSHASTATTYGASSASNYGHAMASSTSPKANGTAAVGSETAKFARGDHVHPHNCVNNLTSTSTTAPLAANQGKVLKDSLTWTQVWTPGVSGITLYANNYFCMLALNHTTSISVGDNYIDASIDDIPSTYRPICTVSAPNTVGSDSQSYQVSAYVGTDGAIKIRSPKAFSNIRINTTLIWGRV